jgi:hypothetical protein
MSVRQGLAVFGVSASIAAGGGYALNEAVNAKDKHNQQQACQTEKYAGTAACKDMIVTPTIVHGTHNTEKAYTWLAAAGLIAGALGLLRSSNLVSEAETKPQPEPQTKG